MNAEPFCLTVTLVARAGAEEQMATCLEHLAQASRAEPGCWAYNAHRSLEDPRRFYIYELYRDEAALASHGQSAHFARYATGELYGLVDERHLEKWGPVAVAAPAA